MVDFGTVAGRIVNLWAAMLVAAIVGGIIGAVIGDWRVPEDEFFREFDIGGYAIAGAVIGPFAVWWWRSVKRSYRSRNRGS